MRANATTRSGVSPVHACSQPQESLPTKITLTLHPLSILVGGWVATRVALLVSAVQAPATTASAALALPTAKLPLTITNPIEVLVTSSQ